VTNDFAVDREALQLARRDNCDHGLDEIGILECPRIEKIKEFAAKGQRLTSSASSHYYKCGIAGSPQSLVVLDVALKEFINRTHLSAIYNCIAIGNHRQKMLKNLLKLFPIAVMHVAAFSSLAARCSLLL